MEQSTSSREIDVWLTKDEMGMLANAVAGFYNLASKEKLRISPEQTAPILRAMEKFKAAATRLDSGIIL